MLKLDIDESQFRRKIERKLLKKLKAATRRGMSRFMLLAKSYAIRGAPKRHGNLKRSIRKETKGRGLDVVGILRATASYAKFVHDGTGIYGPLKRAFEPHMYPVFEGKRFVRMGLASGRGQKPQPFAKDAIERAWPRAPQIFKDEMKKARD